MSTIRCIYHPKEDGTPQEPNFPATDQHPDAVRYLIGNYYVDAIGGEPTLAEVETAARPAPLDISDIDNLDKTLKALALLTRQYANQLKAGTYVTKTVADTRSDFMTIFRALP